MAIPRLSSRRLLSPSDFSPSQSNLKVIGTFNPGATIFQDKIILLVRVAESAIETQDGFVDSPHLKSPSRNTSERYTIDHLRIKNMDDRRKPLLPSGLRRLSSISHFEIVECDRLSGDVLSIRQHDDLFPVEAYESYGIEDARICPIDAGYLITYTAVSPDGIAAAAMITKDFQSFERLGILFPPENKNVVIWQRETNHYVALHRPTGFTPVTRSGVWLSESHNLTHWGQHQFLFGPTHEVWESGKVGIAAPPLTVNDKLLVLYHAVEYRSPDDLVGIYRLGAILLDKNNPSIILGRARGPLLEPESDFEKQGFVPQVVFVTGAISDKNENLQLYYGAADSSVGVVSLSIKAVFDSIS